MELYEVSTYMRSAGCAGETFLLDGGVYSRIEELHGQMARLYGHSAGESSNSAGYLGLVRKVHRIRGSLPCFNPRESVGKYGSRAKSAMEVAERMFETTAAVGQHWESRGYQAQGLKLKMDVGRWERDWCGEEKDLVVVSFLMHQNMNSRIKATLQEFGKDGMIRRHLPMFFSMYRTHPALYLLWSRTIMTTFWIWSQNNQRISAQWQGRRLDAHAPLFGHVFFHGTDLQLWLVLKNILVWSLGRNPRTKASCGPGGRDTVLLAPGEAGFDIYRQLPYILAAYSGDDESMGNYIRYCSRIYSKSTKGVVDGSTPTIARVVAAALALKVPHYMAKNEVVTVALEDLIHNPGYKDCFGHQDGLWSELCRIYQSPGDSHASGPEMQNAGILDFVAVRGGK